MSIGVVLERPGKAATWEPGSHCELADPTGLFFRAHNPTPPPHLPSAETPDPQKGLTALSNSHPLLVPLPPQAIIPDV